MLTEEKKPLKPKKVPMILRFTPYAFAKLMYMRDHGKTEIGGYGITPSEDPMLVTDFKLIKQVCTDIHVELDEEDSAKYVEEMDDLGLMPWMTSIIWAHTHPGNCAKPSFGDEANFTKNFSHSNYAIFYILAKGGDDYCRIQYNVGPGGSMEIPVEIDYRYSFPGSDFEKWKKEYDEKVTEKKITFDLSNYKKVAKGLLYSGEKNDLGYMYGNDIPQIMDNMDDEMDEVFYDTQEELFFYWDDITDEYYTYDHRTKEFRNYETQKIVKDRSWMQEVIDYADEAIEEEMSNATGKK